MIYRKMASFGGSCRDTSRSKESSSPKGSHLQALTDPDMSLSTHPALIVQPEALYQVSANGQIDGNFEVQNAQDSALLSVVGLLVS